jgi:release factor glutamine methyltransferase
VNCRQALAQARQFLENNGVENSLLEGEILVRFVLDLDRAGLFSNLDLELSQAQIEKLNSLIERRLTGEPSAYITGHKEFYGLDFKVDPRVLIPRPETELLVDKALEYCRRFHYSSIADIGTGSGCIAVILAKELPEMMVYAIDCSVQTLELAWENVVFHGLEDRIKLLLSNLVEQLPEPVDMITANLPYIKTSEINLKFEPVLALDGGADGLDLIKKLISQLPGKLKNRGMLVLEVGLGQAKAIQGTLHKVFPKAVIEIYKDLAGIERMVTMRLTA